MLLNQETFEVDVLASDEPVLVDFFGTWCPPCKALAPVVEKLAREGYPVCKVDVKARADLAARYRVTAVPTLVVLKGGEEIARFVGLQSERALKAALDRARGTA